MGTTARALEVGLEVQVYGRVPLALSARCYHARAHGRVKDNCQFVCEQDPDGMELKTLNGQPFLSINGIQTLSHTCLNLAREMKDLQAMGISAFRLSPHSGDMVRTAEIFRALADDLMSPADAVAEWRSLAGSGWGFRSRTAFTTGGKAISGSAGRRAMACSQRIRDAPAVSPRRAPK
jgi:collagenase-like PrtC family protease